MTTDEEFDEFLRWARTHTALGRLSIAELQEAFDRLATAGYSMQRHEPAG